MNFVLYPIHWLAGPFETSPFDLRLLPFEVAEGVSLEDVQERLPESAFDLWKEKIGTAALEELKRVRYALVDRYEDGWEVIDGQIVGQDERRKDAETRVILLAACLRLIRPMPQQVFIIRGKLKADRSFDVTGFDAPSIDRIEGPSIQKSFMLRNKDAEDLRAYAPRFLKAMRGNFGKFKMAVEFHEVGFFQPLFWKARYLLWCSAIESIYTSHSREHKGSLVATSRIKWFLGENTNIYPAADYLDFVLDNEPTVGQVVGDLYEMRNSIAHGDTIPDRFFAESLRDGVTKAEALLEAASFIIRISLLRILRDDLLGHFVDAATADAYFGAQGLTHSVLSARARSPESTERRAKK